MTEQIKPYADKGDSDISTSLEEAKSLLSDEIESIKSHSSEYETKVDSEIVDLEITTAVRTIVYRGVYYMALK